jgi:hypothetical protein
VGSQTLCAPRVSAEGGGTAACRPERAGDVVRAITGAGGPGSAARRGALAAGPPGRRPRPILRRVRALEGWLDPEEAALLLGAAALAVRLPPTWERSRRDVRAAGVDPVVAPIKARSYEVVWGTPIALLFLDGLHDCPNVARDFAHFVGWLRPGGLVAFHDYVDDFPGVKRFVDERLRAGGFRLVRRVESLVVLEQGER